MQKGHTFHNSSETCFGFLSSVAKLLVVVTALSLLSSLSLSELVAPCSASGRGGTRLYISTNLQQILFNTLNIISIDCHIGASSVVACILHLIMKPKQCNILINLTAYMYHIKSII